MSNIYGAMGILIVATILLSSYTSAFAVSSAYWEENPLILGAGETRDIELTLQNLASSEDVHVKATISAGSEVIELIDVSDEYTVPAGEKTTVNLRVTLPENAEAGDVYNVEVKFTTIAGSESGEFSLGSSIGENFNIVVRSDTADSGEDSQEGEISEGLIVILVIIAIIIIWLLVKKKTKKK
ncbi:MAG: NEW3 domain-containing protein [Nanoarchaeota archaeon]